VARLPQVPRVGCTGLYQLAVRRPPPPAGPLSTRGAEAAGRSLVETILAPGNKSWTLRAAKSSMSRNTSKEETPCSKEGTPGPLSMNDRINFVSGNPFVEVTKGVIHLYKLSEPVPDTEMMAMQGVPAKHRTTDRCAVLCCAVQCSAVLSAVQCSAVLAALQCSVGRSAVQCWLQCSKVHYSPPELGRPASWPGQQGHIIHSSYF
jgi:hypothetical protein